MVTCCRLIDTIAMIGSPALRGAVASMVRSGRPSLPAASAGGARVKAVSAAVAAKVTTAGGVNRRIDCMDGAIANALVTRTPVQLAPGPHHPEAPNDRERAMVPFF